MNKNIKIKLDKNPSDKYIKIKLDQDFDTLEILSLKLSQSEVYSSFNADYGVLVGKVQANNNIGVPNAKISVFIPITDDDKLNPDILSIYPYESTRDKDNDGKKYNLLPRVSQGNQFLTQGAVSPPVPVGSFPTKEEILTNPTFLEVYEKYYKYTTVSNEIGDYMIFGVPIGVQDVHMSVDITDIGRFSMTPGTMISQLGYSASLFDGNKIKKTTDLDILPNVELQTISVDVKPFWGDENNFEIGITRQDFKLRATLVSSVIVFGAGFTDNHEAIWGSDTFFGNRDDSSSAMGINKSSDFDGNINAGVKFNTGIFSRRNGNFSIEVYTIPNTISSEDIASGNFDTQKNIVLLDKSQYNEILDDGMFILTLPCNRTKKIFDQTTGDLVLTTDDDPNGVFTEFCGMFIIDYAPELTIRNDPSDKPRSDRNRADRGRLKIPQSTDVLGNTFTSERSGIVAGKTVEERKELNEIWRKQTYTFTGGKLYTISTFQATTSETLADGATFNQIGTNVWRNAGVLATISTDDETEELPANATANYEKIGTGGDETINNVPVFGAEWLNMCTYYPQIYNYTNGIYDVTRLLTSDNGDSTDMTIENNYRVVGLRKDTSYFLRSDLYKTTFTEVPTADLVNILTNIPDSKGFSSNDLVFSTNPLLGNYPSTGTVKYFYRGIKNADILQFLVDNGIVSI